MSTIASEFTKEQLQQIIETDHVQCGEASALARIALASLEAEAVAWTWEIYGGGNMYAKIKPTSLDAIPLYTAPPAPVSVPECFKRLLHHAYGMTMGHDWNKGTMAGHHRTKLCQAVEECRAATFQGAEPVTKANKLPMQPLVIDAHGTLRFKENPIVRTLLDYATEHGYGLNEMALDDFDAEDRMQLAQLIGYSLSGYGDLSYVTDESYDRASAAAPQQEGKP